MFQGIDVNKKNGKVGSACSFENQYKVAKLHRELVFFLGRRMYPYATHTMFYCICDASRTPIMIVIVRIIVIHRTGYHIIKISI